MDFKAAVKQDIANVFHNSGEFAEELAVKYDGKRYTIPVVLDQSGEKDRKKRVADNAEGVFICDAVAYINAGDLPVTPRKDRSIEIEDDLYNIVKTEVEMGELVLYLEMLDE